MLAAPQPEYPPEALAKRIQGTGVYDVWIRPETGVVTRVDISPSTGSKLLDDAANRGCEQGILGRFGGVVGIVIIALSYWVAVGLWPAVVQGMQLFRAGHRGGRRPEHSATDSVQQRGLSSVDVGSEARRRLVRSRARSVGALAGICGLMLLLPSQVTFIFFLCFGLIMVAIIARRDLAASRSSDTQAASSAQSRNSVGAGPPQFTGGVRNIPIILGLLLPGMALIGLGLLFSWMAGVVVVCAEAGKALLTLETFVLAGATSVVVGAAPVVAGLFLVRIARWAAARGSAELLAADDRAPVLYLRSFSDDPMRIRSERWARRTWLDRLAGPARERFEQVVAWHLWSYGPVIAIRRPDGSRQPVGAAREELDGDDWTRQIDEWLVSARLVTMTLGRTTGLQWEINRIRELGLHEKLLVLFPPIAEPELDSRWREFRECWHPGIAASPLLDRTTYALAATMDEDGRATIITGYRRDEGNYRLAITTAAQRLRIAPLAWDLLPQRRAADTGALPAPLTDARIRSKLYYVAQHNEVIGPFGVIQLRRMAANRQITPATLVATKDQPWTPIARIPGIYSPRSRRTALILAFFGGVFGLDRFYLGMIITGLVKLLTFGGLGAWWLIDLIGLSSRVSSRVVTDVNGRPLR
jgi:hypothetical protein